MFTWWTTRDVQSQTPNKKGTPHVGPEATAERKGDEGWDEG